jgi:hypothetical protein
MAIGKIKEKNKGKFTAYAKGKGKSVQSAASTILAHKGNYSSTLVRRANFAKNAKKWKHEDGGLVEYSWGGSVSALGDVAGMIPTPWTQVASGIFKVAGGLLGAKEAADEQKVEQARLEEVRKGGIAQASNMAQAGISSNYRATFQDGGKVAVPPQGKWEVDPNKDAVNYNQFFGPMADQMRKLQTAGEKNKNLKVAMTAGMATHDLNNYNEAPVMTSMMNKKIPPMNKQAERVQGFVNSLSDEQINQLGKQYPKSGVIDKFNYIRDLHLSPGQFAGAASTLAYKKKNKLAAGGVIPNGQPNVEVEGGEVLQGNDGSLASVQGPKHSQGGVPLLMENGGRVFSDKIINPDTGNTFADDAAKFMKMMK